MDAVLYLIAKAAVSGVLVMAISEIARRSPTVGALVAALPLVSLLAILWLWFDTRDTARIASLAEGTFWLVLPSLPMFLALPALLRAGVAFWVALVASVALTVGLYLLTVWLLPKLGIEL
jgi:hypothetical protein